MSFGSTTLPFEGNHVKRFFCRIWGGTSAISAGVVESHGRLEGRQRHLHLRLVRVAGRERLEGEVWAEEGAPESPGRRTAETDRLVTEARDERGQRQTREKPAAHRGRGADGCVNHR